jgi:DNA-binding CsgD family transcriptional regulator
MMGEARADPTPWLTSAWVPKPPDNGHREVWSALWGLLLRAIDGRGGVAWLEGEAGIGKSTLVDTFLASAVLKDVRMLRAGADDPSQPLRLMARLFGSLCGTGAGETAALCELMVARQQAGDVVSATEHIMALTGALCAAGPVLLVVEDLHASDDASLLAWNRLARVAPSLPLLLVSTSRALPYRPRLVQLRELIRQRRGTIITVGPLAESDVERLAEHHLGAKPGPALSAYLAVIGGNPRRVGGLLTELSSANLIRTLDASSEVLDDPQADSVLVRHLLGPVPEATRTLLRSAALLGSAFDPVELGLATATPLPELAASLAGAIQHGILRATGDRITFCHELVRRALAHAVPGPDQLAFYGEAARVLARSGAAPETVARHLLASAEMTSWAADWLGQVPEASLLTQSQAFASLLGRAMQVLADDDHRWSTVAARYAIVQYWAGQYDGAAQWALAVADRRPDTTLAATMTMVAIRAQIRRGRPLQAVELLHSNLARYHIERPGGEKEVRRAAWLAVATADLGRHGESVAHAEHAWRLATRLNDATGGSLSTTRVATASAAHALVRAGRGGEIVGAIAAVREALADDLESRELRGWLFTDLIALQIQLGQVDAVRAILAETPALIAQLDPAGAMALRASAADAYYRLGQWDQTLAELDRPAPTEANPGLSGRGLAAVIAMHRQDPDTAEQELTAAATAGDPLNRYRTEALAMRAEAEGTVHLALALRIRILDRSATNRPTRVDGIEHLVRLALAVDDWSRAAAVVRRCEAAAAEEGLALQVATARCVRAQLENDTAALLIAATEFSRLGAPHQQAMALEEAAVRLARSDDKVTAGKALNEATRVYSMLGAAWDLARAENRLREHGLRRRMAARRPTTGWEALTPAEARVARLVTSGLSNPDIAAKLFLTRHTVQSHLSKILRKLGLRSRVDIIRVAPEKDDATP